MLRSRLATAWCFASAAARLLFSSRPVTKPWIWRRSTGGRGGARSAAAGQWHQWCSVVAPAARQRAFSAARRASMRLGWWVEAAGGAERGSMARFPRQFDSAALPEEELRAVALQHLRRSVLSQRSVETCREWWTGHQGAFANRALFGDGIHAS